jgi:large repetitive protein
MRPYLTTLGSLAAVGVMLASFSSCGSDPSKTPRATKVDTDPDLAAAKAALAAVPLGRVVSRDARGAGRYVLASREANAPRLNLGHETVARLHFERHAAAIGLSEAALRGAVFAGWHKLPGGAGLAQFEQRIDNTEVFHARASVVVDAANQLVSIGSSFPASNIKVWNKLATFKKTAEEALAAAYTAHAGVPLRASAVRDLGEIQGTSMRNYEIDGARGALQVLSATAKRVLFPTGDRLEAGYYVEILGRAAGSRDNDARSYVIAADDMRVLYEESLTLHEAFNYKVFADTTGLKTPLDGPIQDVNPHPTGTPDLKPQANAPPVMIAMEGFNKNPNGVADPWLQPTDTYTWGNNVRAYSDRNQSTNDAGGPINDGFQDAGADGGGGDYRAEITTARTFDYTYDPAIAPNATPNQVKAAITQLFYTNNWLHDFWYDAGFDEVSHNGQVSNYGRGGAEGDPIRAEAQDSADSGQANNANMSTLADGTAPRMQMYVWTGLPNRTLEVAGVTFTDPFGAAAFGPQVFDMMGSAVLSDDMSTVVPPGGTGMVGTTTDACQAPANIMGRIAVIDRGTCTFIIKATNAQAAGATGIILINNVPGNIPPNAAGALPSSTIPLLGVSMEDGAKLKAALMAGMPMSRLRRGAEVQRDGTIDNTIVAHEWGHYWHHRLVQCSGKSCGGMSEGWGDFVALMMSIRDGDTFDGKAYALAQYASQGISKDGSYFGIRRAPYSREMTKNPFTFTHVRAASTLPPMDRAPLAPTGADLSEVHNVGEIWTETLFEAYANLIEAGKAATPPRSFDESQRLMAKYLVAGMKATPSNPTFVEQRDAILAAVYATKQFDDFTALAKGFAKRGLGVAAIAPIHTSMTLNEAEENFDYKGNLDFVEAAVDDSGTSCDKDGVLDANETGKLTVKLRNNGWVKLTKAQIKATSPDANVTFAMPGTTTVELEPYETKTLTLDVTAKAGLTKRTTVPVTITMTDSEAAKPSVDVTYPAVVHSDEVRAASKTDDVESAHAPVWGMANVPAAGNAWSRAGDATNHVWRGEALVSAGEASLISPPLNVSATEPFTIGFKHHYTFEVSMGLNADGAVLEIAEDTGDGGTDAGTLAWKDVSDYVDPMYTGALYTMPGMDTNPLAGRRAWVGQSSAYPMNVPVSLNLDTKLAGKTVRVRFRIATDEGTGSAGWDIDDIAFGGITNSPFTKIGDHAGMCGDAGTPTDGGTRDASTGTGGAGGTGGGTPPSDDCSCSIPGAQSNGGASAAVGLLAALATVLRRRRRQQS